MRRAGVPPAMPDGVDEVAFEATRPLRLEWHRDAEWADDEDQGQHLISAEAVAARNGDRAFVARDGDGEPVGFVSLFSPPGFRAGEIEQAYVTPAFRGRGIGSRLIAAALAAGAHDENWIVADDEDRPKLLYERLGFRPVWKRYEFTRVPG
jgi:ribosomal protein S18 acetylase RimI-like enzyme